MEFPERELSDHLNAAEAKIAREYEEALARGDERTLQVEEFHQKTLLLAEYLLKFTAELYFHCKRADFWQARRVLDEIRTQAELQLKAHKHIIGEED